MQTASTRITEGYFTGPDGHHLYERSWHPAGSPRAALVLVHGYAEHIARYDYAANAFARAGYLARAYDQRGHGRSDGDRAFVREPDEYQRDLDAFLARVREEHPALPMFILGHSMGGAVVALYAAERRPDVCGVILSGPALGGGGRRAGILMRIMRFIGRFFPRLPLTKLKAEGVSRDPAVVAAYAADPLVYRGRMRAGFADAMLRGMRRITASAGSLVAPLLIMHGTGDALTSPEGSKRLIERAGSADKTLRLLDGLHHEILNEPERDSVIAEMIAWMDARLPSA